MCFLLLWVQPYLFVQLNFCFVVDFQCSIDIKRVLPLLVSFHRMPCRRPTARKTKDWKAFKMYKGVILATVFMQVPFAFLDTLCRFSSSWNVFALFLFFVCAWMTAHAKDCPRHGDPRSRASRAATSFVKRQNLWQPQKTCQKNWRLEGASNTVKKQRMEKQSNERPNGAS